MAHLLPHNFLAPLNREPLAPLSNAVNITPSGTALGKSALNPKSTSTKRPYAAVDDSSEEIEDDDRRIYSVTDSCDQIRTKINTFINNGGMKVGEFQHAIGVTSSSYGNFMKKRGRDAGDQSSVYNAANAFFRKRELAGDKMPRKKAKKETGADGKETGKNLDYDVSDIHLEGEDEGEVEIYDTCDDIRRKIAAHLRAPGITQAGFCRALSAQFPEFEGKKLSSAQLQAFQRKKGPLEGNSSGVLYAAYVFFEKLRIKQGKKKSKARLEMEKLWGNEGGVSRELQRGYLVRRSEEVAQDRYGKVTIVRGGDW